MPGDIKDKVEKLKKEAIERCKKRIEQAAEKQNGISIRRNYGFEGPGMTSVLKKRHGL